MIRFYCNHYYVKTFFVHSTKASAQVKTELSKPSSTNIQLQSQWVSVGLKIMIINMFRLGDKIVQTSTIVKFLKGGGANVTVRHFKKLGGCSTFQLFHLFFLAGSCPVDSKYLWTRSSCVAGRQAWYLLYSMVYSPFPYRHVGRGN